jgi:hypothetical protein
MKTGKLTEIAGYIPYMQSERWRREDATYQNVTGYIATNAVLMTVVGVVTYLIARRAFTIQRSLLRWLFGAGTIAGGLFGLFCVFFVVTLYFYDGDGRGVPRPGGPWVNQYESSMSLLAARMLLGHEPEGALQVQVNDHSHLVANKEILLLADMGYDRYVLVPAASVQQVRRIANEEIRSKPSLNFDPAAEVVSLIPGDPGSLWPYHEKGDFGLGPIEVTLNTPRPRAIWFLRAYPEEPMKNEDFLPRLMKALHPEAATQAGVP